jgi:transcriptional regulator with XRE-family HTH domain
MGEAPGGDDAQRVMPGSAPRRLREVRAERLMSIRELAQRASVAPSTIYMIEAGRSLPQLAVVRRLAEVLDIDPQWVEEFRRSIRAHGGLR